MDGHNASSHKSAKRYTQKHTYLQKHHNPSSTAKNNIKITNTSKSQQPKLNNGRPKTIPKPPKDHLHHHHENVQLFDCFNEDEDGDSDYEFSQQIMENNTKKESRRSREDTKLLHLAIFDWMINLSALLKIRKETAYRAIIMFKKFLFLEQKMPASKVTLSNSKFYGLASLLIFNKLDNINGNFLPRISQLIRGGLGNTFQKQAILECQIYIMRVMKFNINQNILIMQTLIDAIHIWNSAIKNTPLSPYTFSPYERILQSTHEHLIRQEEQKNDLLEVLIFLMDFVIMRKLVQMKVRDMHSLERPEFYKKVIFNILYHLLSFLIARSYRELKIVQSKALRTVFTHFANNLNLQKSDHSVLFRKSHLLSKQIRSVFSNEQSMSRKSIHEVACFHNKIKREYCVCNLASLSKKFLDLEEHFRLQKYYEQLIIYKPLQEQQLKQEYETDLLVKSPPKKPKQMMEIAMPKGQCVKCLKDQKWFCELINKQFYIPIYYKDKS